MKKLLTLTLVAMVAFTGLSAAQERKAGEKPAVSAAKSALKGVIIKGNAATLEKGFAFRKTGTGTAQVLDPTGRQTITISCFGCSSCNVTIVGSTASCTGNCGEDRQCLLETVVSK